MPKNKGKRNSPREYGSDDDQTSVRSDASDDGYGLAEEEREIEIAEAVTAACDALYEKRASTREKGLLDLLKLMQRYNLYDSIEDRIETVLHDITNSAKKGAPSEAINALRVLRAVLVTLGTAVEAHFQELMATLKPLVTSHKNAGVRGEASYTLAFATFVGAEEESDTESVFSLVCDIINSPVDDPHLLGALEAYGLLVSILSASTVSSKHFKRGMDLFIPLLEHDELEVRIGAGENIALLFEAMYDVDEDYSNEFDELADMLHSLATDSSKKRSKKERSKQRSIFRDILKYVEEGEAPEETLKMKNEKVSFDSWTAIRHLDAFREALGMGFHIHFKQNDFVREVLQLGPAPADVRVTTNDKRMRREQHSWQSRMRSQLRAKQRGAVAVKRQGEASCYADGE